MSTVYVLLVWTMIGGQPVPVPGLPTGYQSAALCEHYREKIERNGERLATCQPHPASLCKHQVRCQR